LAQASVAAQLGKERGDRADDSFGFDKMVHKINTPLKNILKTQNIF
jgi:hypothetical protein